MRGYSVGAIDAVVVAVYLLFPEGSGVPLPVDYTILRVVRTGRDRRGRTARKSGDRFQTRTVVGSAYRGSGGAAL